MTDKLKKLIEDELESAYARGRTEAEANYRVQLKMAKELAYDQGLSEGKRINEKGCEGCAFEDTSRNVYPCNRCRNKYKDMWRPKKKDDEIEYGDEVIDEDGVKGIVVSKNNTDRASLYVLFSKYDVPQAVIKINYKKTGKHYDLDAFMEELKG